MADIGVALPTRLGTHALTPDELLRIAETADALPQWDHLWVTDSVISLPFYDSVVLLAACAARTQRIRLGVAWRARPAWGSASHWWWPSSGPTSTCSQEAG